MKTKYSEFIQRHGLPELKGWLEVEDDVTIRGIRSGFSEKLAGFTEFTFMLIQPEDVTSLSEAAQFSEPELEAIHKLYNRLVLLSKECLLVDIASTEEEELALIRTLVKEWPSLVSEIKDLVHRTKEAYNGSTKGSHDVSYLG